MTPAGSAHQVTVGGRRLRLTNLDKVLYPEAGFTKADVIDYYQRIAPALLPHTRDRPLTMKRYPNGVDDEFFYQKECPKHRPEWMRTVPVWSRSNNRHVNFCVVDDEPALIWTANLACLELHTSMSLATDVSQPRILVFDFDPGPPATVVECCRVALLVRELLGAAGLECFAKTSGSKGLQLYAPINTPATYDDTKTLARACARVLEERHPDLIVSNMRKTLRGGKVLIDWSQNDDMKTTVSVYSLRARSRPTVSTPITWDEVENCLSRGDPELLVFDSAQVLKRVHDLGDLFEPVQRLKQKLPQIPPA
ncbi:MAG: non-homologous end-joining DNA ligase [Gaiellales bacterium]